MKKIILVMGLGFCSAVLLPSGCKDAQQNEPKQTEKSGTENKVDPSGSVKPIDQSLVLSYLNGLPNATKLRSTNDGPLENEGEPVEVEGEGGSNTGDLTLENGVPGHWVTSTKKYKITHAYDEALLLDPKKEIIYPGCVLSGESVSNGTFAFIPGIRTGEITYSISKTPADDADRPELTVTQPWDMRMSDYRNAFNRWASIRYKPTPSILVHALDVVNNAKEIHSRLGVTVGTPWFDLKSNLGLDFSSKKNHIVGKFIQIQYSVTMDAPKQETIFTALPKNLQTKPVYVSNINYGRIAFVSIETDEKLTDVQAAIDFALKKNENIPVDVDVNLEHKYKKILNNSKISYTVMGGDTQTQNSVMQGTLEGLRAYMSADLPMEQMVPVSFSLRYAHDLSLARILTETEQTVTKREFVPDFERIHIDIAPEGFILKGDIDKTNELLGNAFVEMDGKRIGSDLFNIQSWIRFRADGSTFSPYTGSGSKHIVIERKKDESPEAFLNRRISIVTDLKEKQPVKIYPYGQGRVEMSISDLISLWSDNQSSFFVTSMTGNYLAKTRFAIRNIRYETKDKKSINPHSEVRSVVINQIN